MGSNCVWAIFVEGVDPSTTSSSSAARLKRFCDQKNINSAAIFCGAVRGHDVAAGGGLLRRPRLLQYREILPYLVGYKQLLYTLSKLNLVHFTLSQEFFDSYCMQVYMYVCFIFTANTMYLQYSIVTGQLSPNISHSIGHFPASLRCGRVSDVLALPLSAARVAHARTASLR